MLNELYLGRLRWDLLTPFPEQDAADRLAGDPVLASLEALLRTWIDPDQVEDDGRLPDGFGDALQDGGFLRLMIDPQLGGLGLSIVNAFRVVEAAASWSTPVAFMLAIQNGFGSGSYLPVLPEGPLRDMVSSRVAGGIVSAGADAESAGTANKTRTTVAVPVEDGAAFLITGEKVFIGNAPLADLMDVSATVTADDGTQEVRLFFVDSRNPGFTVAALHEFMGLRGAAIGAVRLESVRVPAEHLLDESGDGWRMRPGPRAGAAFEQGPESSVDAPPDLARLAAVGRTLVIAPTSLAIAKLCLAWSRDFVSRRSIDGRSLGDYDEIKRIVATTAADVFTIETVAAWALLGHAAADTQPDLTSAKNLTSVTCWRAVDRTLSLLGAEGYETSQSKQRRGAPALPVERAFRDARALRIAGGVDFMLDKWSAESSIASRYYATPPDAAAESSALEDGALSPRCREHVRFVEAQARALARLCHRLTRGSTQEELYARQRTVGTIGRIANELLSMSLVLARAAGLAANGDSDVTDLADISCSASKRRLDGLWPQLDDEPDYATASAAALHGGILAELHSQKESAVRA